MFTVTGIMHDRASWKSAADGGGPAVLANDPG